MSRVVIGLPAYNGGEHVDAALDSLLAQTHGDFQLVVCDDGSTDGTAERLEEYARRDERVHFTRNSQRLGMIGNWRRVFEVARSVAPDMRFFAWASDHDIWAPGWLEALLRAFEADPSVVLAYSRARGFSGTPDNVVHTPGDFASAGVGKRRRRMREAWFGMAAGYMVYGLFRAEELERCGVYRYVRDPDRLLIFELAAFGTFYQVPDRLFFRRRTDAKPSVGRQMAAFFPDRRRPVYTYLPWPVAHSAMLGWSLGVRGDGRPRLGRLAGVAVGLWYLKLGFGLELRRQIRLRQRSRIAPVRNLALLAGRVVNLKPSAGELAAPTKPPKHERVPKLPKPPKPEKERP